MTTTELLLQGGRVLDPAQDLDELLDVAVAEGRIAALAPSLSRPDRGRIIDVSGLLVTPGLIDLHTHVFAGQDLGVDSALWAPPSATTTLVDAGSAGAHLFNAFRQGYIEPARERILAFVNISTIGTTSILLAGEAENLNYCSSDICARCVEEHRDVALGVKIRASGNVVGRNGIKPLEAARKAADQANVPLMVHVGPSPPLLEEILHLLGDGDILTHCFTGFDNRLITEGGEPRRDVLAARDRGVVFDVGHGMAAFDAEVAASMISAGFLPDVISTDVHAYALDSVRDFPTTISKFLALGVELDQAIKRSTSVPARLIARPELGSLEIGTAADIAVFAVEEGSFMYADTGGTSFAGTSRLSTRYTILGGQVVYEKP